MVIDNLKCFIIERRLNKLRKRLWNLKFSDITNQIKKVDSKILEEIQKFKLLKTLKHSAENSPFYREKVKHVIPRIGLNRVFSLIDEVPFTTPDDVSKRHNSFLSVPYSDVVAFHFTAGTTGKSKRLYLSKSDLEMVIYNYYLGLLSSELEKTDVAQIMYSFGIWQLGNLYQQALNKMGVKCLPTGNHISFEEQSEYIKDYDVSFIAGTPSYVYQFSREVDLLTSSREKMKTIQMGGEHLSQRKRSYIEGKIGGEIFLAYGLMEFGGGIGSECKNHQGYHVLTTVYPEIVDLNNGEPVENEEFGELVLTSLDREAMPLLRYRTRDITRFVDGECDCGLKLQLIDYIKGRCDDRVTIGTAEKYYPIVFEELFDDIHEVNDFQIEISKTNGRDHLNVYVKAKNPSENLKAKIIGKLYEISSLKMDVENTKTVSAPQILFTEEMSHGIKKRSVIDKRRNVWSSRP
ncbi:MAG: phenylacetate--CoA ligase family protein [Candidatus Hodarchaeota archaeon]